MKKLLIWAVMLTSIICVSCTKSDSDDLGSIYGIVTEEGTTEPVRGLSVELRQGVDAYYDNEEGEWAAKSVITVMRATTFSDGHFECEDLEPGVYAIIADNSQYFGESGPIKVEAGRQTKVDILVYKQRH